MPKTTTPIVGVFNEAGQLTGVIPESGSAAGASRVVTADANGNLYANGSPVSWAGNLGDPMLGGPAQAWGGGTIVAADYAISSGSPTLSVETRNGMQCLKIVTGVGVTANIDLTLQADTGWFDRTFMTVEGNRGSGVAQCFGLVTADSFTNYAMNGFTTQATPTAMVWDDMGGGAPFTVRLDGGWTYSGASWGSVAPAKDGSVAVNKMRFRVIPVAGQSATIYLYGVSMAPRRKKGRVFITADDGYKSFMSLLFPIFQARGIPVTMSVIAPVIGDRADTASNYLTVRDLYAIKSAGGQIVAHGPGVAYGGNLFTSFSSTAARIADMSATRDWITRQGLSTPGYDQVYVWPQGTAQSGPDDLDLLNAALAAGFTVGRAVSVATTRYWEAESLTPHQRLILPTIGHGYAGAGEAANISGIVSAIQAAGTQKSDVVLMLHKGFKTGDTPSSIGMLVADCITIADAIVTERDAGRMSCGVLGDMGRQNLWRA